MKFLFGIALAFSIIKTNPVWVEFAKSYTITFSYDKSNIKKIDSSKSLIWIKQVPLPESYTEVKIGKMKENKIEKGYDEFGKPKNSFQGFENYGFTILQEEIDCKKDLYRILKIIEYDMNGEVLKNSEDKIEWAYVVPGTAQMAILDSLCN